MAIINFLAGKIVSLKDDGTVNAGGKVTFYVADGTFSTAITTYSNKSLTTPNSSPIILDSSGRAKAYFSVNADVKYLTSADVLVYSERDVAPQNLKTVYSKSISFSIDATYADSVIEITASLTATLASAATLGAGFSLTIVNTAAVTSTLARANAGDTINGTAANITIQANSSIEVTVNSGVTGFLVDTIGAFPVTVANGGTGSTTAGAARTALAVGGLATDNTWTADQTISSVDPQLIFIETDGVADNKRWDLVANTEGFFIRAVNDAVSVATDIIAVQRTGTTVDSVTIGGATVAVPGLVSLTGGQLKFPATAVPSADVNTLDDYEEGTFTPGIAFGGASVGVTYATQTGSYVKIGKLVYFQLEVTLTNKGSSVGSATITGLPFSYSISGVFPIHAFVVTFSGYIVSRNTGTNSLLFAQTTDAGVQSNLADGNFANTSSVVIAGSYIT